MKYGNISSAGFSSKLEAAVSQIHELMVKAGSISELRCQHPAELTAAKIRCKIDFSFIEDGRLTFAEAKGVETDRWKIIEKLWRFYGPGKLYIYKGSYLNPKITEVIVPFTGQT